MALKVSCHKIQVQALQSAVFGQGSIFVAKLLKYGYDVKPKTKLHIAEHQANCMTKYKKGESRLINFSHKLKASRQWPFLPRPG